MCRHSKALPDKAQKFLEGVATQPFVLKRCHIVIYRLNTDVGRRSSTHIKKNTTQYNKAHITLQFCFSKLHFQNEGNIHLLLTNCQTKYDIKKVVLSKN